MRELGRLEIFIIKLLLQNIADFFHIRDRCALAFARRFPGKNVPKLAIKSYLRLIFL